MIRHRHKVPIIMQMEALECGAASLAMIMANYGLWVPLEEVRIACGVSRDGSNAKNIVQAARSYGFEAKGYRYSITELKQLNMTPCIVYWEFNHYVVLDYFTKHHVIINDPARGRVKLSMQEFISSYSGICLYFQKSASFKKAGKKKSIFEFARRQLQGAKTAIIFVVLTTLIATFMNVTFPVFSRVFVDRILSGKNTDWLLYFMIFLAVLCSLSLCAQWISAIYSKKIEGKFAIHANTQFMWHLLHLPMVFFAQRLPGDLLLRKSNHEEIANTLIEILAPLCLQSVLLLVYLFMMFRYQSMLTFIAIIGVCINVWLGQIISNKRSNVNRVQAKNQGLLYASSVAAVELIESIKASGCEENYFQRWAGLHANVNNQKIRNDKINIYLGYLPTLFLQITNIAIIAYAIYLIFQGAFSIGMLLAFQGFMSSFITPAQSLMQSSQVLAEMRVNMERIEDVLAYPKDGVSQSSNEHKDVYEKLKGHIELRHISFGYSRLAQPLIKDFSMVLEPGKKIAFVGESGCGKSTISKLISGLYQAWSGEILFDGVSLNEINHEVFTSSVAVVDQEITLFEDSVRDNLKMWDSSIADFEMILAARDAGIHADILQRDKGFQYQIKAGGKDFSGGQRQRLEIARVLAQDPTILILDEATSALDAKTEYEVVNAISKRGITCIIIAHRLSTIRDCDEIIVLKRGEVVERGTHEELYDKKGYYHRLISNE